ncbi:hypothetical protein STA1M1_21640 [Sinisalibacter aestuarii]|uniref:Uncharacterized protein n=1 Tax=Sinisalibacter aestuarii TaxID=2949426 RepID=A0ABQ5LTI3_9RHOB|nr:hypothetical protein STA1M1_21640 [Sinisalibacter aestuarii]
MRADQPGDLGIVRFRHRADAARDGLDTAANRIVAAQKLMKYRLVALVACSLFGAVAMLTMSATPAVRSIMHGGLRQKLYLQYIF